MISDSKAAEKNELEKQALNNQLLEMTDRSNEYEDKIKQLQSELASKGATTLQEEQIIHRTTDSEIEKKRILKERMKLEEEREQRILYDRTSKLNLDQPVRVLPFSICIYVQLKCSLLLPDSERSFAPAAHL